MATFSHYIFISLPGMDVVNQPGGTISWTSASIRQQSSGMVNSGDDGLLDVGADSFLARENVFTGYTIGFEGETYAIFGRQSGGGAPSRALSGVSPEGPSKPFRRAFARRLKTGVKSRSRNP